MKTQDLSTSLCFSLFTGIGIIAIAKAILVLLLLSSNKGGDCNHETVPCKPEHQMYCPAVRKPLRE